MFLIRNRWYIASRTNCPAVIFLDSANSQIICHCSSVNFIVCGFMFPIVSPQMIAPDIVRRGRFVFASGCRLDVVNQSPCAQVCTLTHCIREFLQGCICAGVKGGHFAIM